MTNRLIKRRSLRRRICDGFRKWLVAPINDDLRLNRRILMEVLANTMEVRTKMGDIVTKEQVDEFVDTLIEKVEKIGGDIIQHVTDLRSQFAAGQDMSSTFSKLEGLGAKLQAVDDFIPERPTAAPAADAGDTAPLPGEASPETSGS